MKLQAMPCLLSWKASEPVHEVAEEGGELGSHLLILIDVGVPVVAIERIAVDGRHIETIDFFVASLLGFGCDFVQQFLGKLQLLIIQHGTC